jgi:hypothetical protein
VGKVKQWWSCSSFQRSPSFVLAWKLKALKLDLKKWNEVFGNVNKQRKALLVDLQGLMLMQKKDLFWMRKMQERLRLLVN